MEEVYATYQWESIHEGLDFYIRRLDIFCGRDVVHLFIHARAHFIVTVGSVDFDDLVEFVLMEKRLSRC